jgi:glycosyltransferase involved in cell wall biosynthesis
VSRCKVPIIYVLDDPLYIPYVSPANGWFSYLKCFGKVATICRLSQAVIANSTAHVDFARRYCANVHQIPSVVDGTAYRYTPRPHSEGPVRIGWSGSPTTAGNLRMIAGALTELAKRVRYRLHLIGSEVLPIPGTDCIAQHWHGPTEIEDLLQLDIGLAPLPDNAWNRRKFNMKIAQYMCLGIVPVATPLGSNREVISPGVDGFLPESAEEWTASLETLVLDEVLRRSMAARAAHKAAASFTVQAQFPNVLRAFSSALPW